jgi:hypothetical protein
MHSILLMIEGKYSPHVRSKFSPHERYIEIDQHHC